MRWKGAAYYCGVCRRTMDPTQAIGFMTVAGLLFLCPDCRELLNDETVAGLMTPTEGEMQWLKTEWQLNRQLPIQVVFTN